MNYHSAPSQTILDTLQTTQNGLSPQESARRLVQYGPNTLTVKGRPLWRTIIEPFTSVFVAVLFVAAGISFWQGAPLDAWIVIGVILISAIIYYIQEFSTERILRSLRKKDNATIRVRYADGERVISVERIVPGDIIILEEGDKVPADCRIIDLRSLRVDESQLTGESLPIEKQVRPVKDAAPLYERSCMLYQGSFVIGGTAAAVVTATGNHTEFGKLAVLAKDQNNQSPVQQKIDKLIEKTIIGMAIVALLTFGLALLRDVSLADALRFVIALAVSAVPEGLPVAISIVLAIGMSRMAKKKALVRSMRAIESIGVVTAIATDKTGTLTKNKLSVQNLWKFPGSNMPALVTLAKSCLDESAGKVRDPLDIAFEQYSRTNNVAEIYHKGAVSFQFEHTLAMSGNLWHKGHEYELYVKGAPEAMLEHADLTENEREQALLMVQSLTSTGARVIALGHTTLRKPIDSLEHLPAGTRFEFDGLVSIADVLRAEAHGAIKKALGAGIAVCMITGDHVETAYHIGKELGLATYHDQVFDCRQLASMPDTKLEKIIPNIRVFARVIPEQKHRILAALNKYNVTAMTGDGVNDVPALTKAHVGLAMGSGVQIAKDAGDIVLLDDNFASIIRAVNEGRVIFANIKRMVLYLLATNLGEVCVAVGSLLIGAPLPLTPVQLLWVNLVTDTSLVIPLGLEPGEKNIMRTPPVKTNAPLLGRTMILRAIVTALAMAAITLSMFMWFLHSHGLDYARTIAFNVIVVLQWANAFSCRSEQEPIWKRLFIKNDAFWLGLAAAMSLQLLALIEPLGPLLHVSPVSIQDLTGTSIAAFVLMIVVVELYKFIANKHTK